MTTPHWPPYGAGQTPPPASQPSQGPSGLALFGVLVGGAFIGWIGGKVADKVFGGAWEKTKGAFASKPPKKKRRK